MKNIFLFVFVWSTLMLGSNIFAQESKVIKTKYFENLNRFDATAKYQWYTGNNELAKELEKSYNLYSSKKNFKKQLLKFADNNVDKYYWIATYLKDDYYTQINDAELSFQFSLAGLEIAKTEKESEQIRYLFVIGKKYYYAGEKEKSLDFLIKGYKLSEQYPGHVPTWNSLEEADEIYAFIKANL